MLLRRGAVEFIRTSRPARTCRANAGQHRGVHRHIWHEPVDTSGLVWFCAWALIRKTRLARWPHLAQPPRPLPPERAMLLVFDPLNPKRQGRHYDLVERCKDLRDPSPALCGVSAHPLATHRRARGRFPASSDYNLAHAPARIQNRPAGAIASPADRARKVTASPWLCVKGPLSTTTSSYSRSRMRDPVNALVRERVETGARFCGTTPRACVLKPARSSTSTGNGMGHNRLFSSPAFWQRHGQIRRCRQVPVQAASREALATRSVRKDGAACHSGQLSQLPPQPQEPVVQRRKQHYGGPDTLSGRPCRLRCGRGLSRFASSRVARLDPAGVNP